MVDEPVVEFAGRTPAHPGRFRYAPIDEQGFPGRSSPGLSMWVFPDLPVWVSSGLPMWVSPTCGQILELSTTWGVLMAGNRDQAGPDIRLIAPQIRTGGQR